MIREEIEYYALVKKVFDVLAPFYDVVAIPISGVRDQVVSVTNAREGSRILDVATGTGKQAFAFAEKGYEVIGVDLSDAMLAVARKNNKFGNVKFETADATNLPYGDNHFDVSCVSFALHDMPVTIREKVLKEIVRVTKTQGVIAIVDYALPKSRVGSFLIYRLVGLYEGEYYSKFIKSDLDTLIRKTGVEKKAELSVLLGAGRILKGTKVEQSL